MPCAETDTKLQAYFDGEMDALGTAEFERHLQGCPSCRAALEALTEMRSALKLELPYFRAPAALAARVAAVLDDAALDGAASDEAMAPEAAAGAPREPRANREPPRRMTGRHSFRWGALSGAGGMALAAVLAFVILTPAADPLLADLVNAHVRSLMPSHLIDVESSDRHTVKPWFAGHADVSPVVVDFATQGYRLVGGRTDYFDGQRAAVVVYQHDAHIINVFSWSDSNGRLPRDTTRNGYRLVFWKAGNLVYCAVSDTGWDELGKLAALIEGADTPATGAPRE
jgi:anti-sigma factor RsiW